MNTPYEWFTEYVDTLSWQETRTLLLQFAQAAGRDVIQDMFQSSMDQGEYSDYEDAPSPYELGYQQGCLGTCHTFGVPYSICPYRESDSRRADWAYGYLDGLGHKPPERDV